MSDFEGAMKSKDIEVGDWVSVFGGFDRLIVRGFVRHIPRATGECWRITENDKTIVYVQQFERIVCTKNTRAKAEGKT